MKYLIAVLFAALITGCAMFQEKPNNATAFTSDQIVAVAKQVERAQALGALSESKGDEYLILLIRANNLLSGTSDFYGDIAACETSTSRFQCIDSILSTVEEGLQ